MAVKRRTPMLVAGLLLVLVGSATATLIGPDDTLMVGEREAPVEATGLAVSTHPVITDFVNLDLLVRASAPGGVFVGSSNRVDTESLLRRTEHYEISRMSLGSVGGRMVDGRRSATYDSLRPDRIVGWLDQTSTSGGDEVELVVPLDGEAVDVVAVPVRSETRVTLALGAHVERLFLSQLALVLTGLLLILLRAGLRARDRRKDARSGGAGPSNGPAGPDRLDAPDPAPARPALPRHPRGAYRAATPPAPAPAVERTPNAPEPETVATAATAAPTPRPERPLPKAITLPVLGVLLLTLALSACAAPQAAPKRPADEPPTRPGMTVAEATEVVGNHDTVLTPSFSGYPVWASVTLTEPRRIQLRVRDSFKAPYRTIATVKVVDEVPAPVAAPRAPSGKVRKKADRTAMAVSTWWATGKAKGVTVTKRTKKIRRTMLDGGVQPDAVWVLGGGPRDQYVVEVERGHLMTVRHQVFTPAPRRLTTVVLLPTGKKPKVLGSKLVDVG